MHLQEIIVGAALHLNQVRHLGHFGNAPSPRPNAASESAVARALSGATSAWSGDTVR